MPGKLQRAADLTPEAQVRRLCTTAVDLGPLAPAGAHSSQCARTKELKRRTMFPRADLAGGFFCCPRNALTIRVRFFVTCATFRVRLSSERLLDCASDAVAPHVSSTLFHVPPPIGAVGASAHICRLTQ